MSDFFEIDFLDVKSTKSGDAITLRYKKGGYESIHVVDAGFQATGDAVVDHIKLHYAQPTYIDHVVATHQDGDHAGGLRKILETFDVGGLWMLRPWTYADELIHRFATYQSVEHLRRKLRATYPNLAALEDIANERNIPIHEPFQGAMIGAFHVLAPSRSRFLDLVVDSEKTPPAVDARSVGDLIENGGGLLSALLTKAISLVRAAWGEEAFSDEGTSNENEMSVIQYAMVADKRILLTGDAGRGGLAEAADYAPRVGLVLPGIDYFQVPHHGSRRNVDSVLLDRWLGTRLPSPPRRGEETFSAVVSAAREDGHHPRNAVVRAMIHRGAALVTTEGKTVCCSRNRQRFGWSPIEPAPYPEDQEG